MKPEKGESAGPRIVGATGIALVVVACLGALWNMVGAGREQEWGGRKVVRICHWQLETGFREGIQYAIAEFEKQNPDVKIVQVPIYARAYLQFLKTQLIGGTAPDLIEMDMTDNGGYAGDLARYFYPITGQLNRPNEYNADNDLRATPWIYTFTDGLRNAYSPQELQYYSAGINTYSMRFFYNKSLLKRITGSDRPPATFRDLMAVCGQIAEYSKKTGRTIFPIAGSKYQAEFTRTMYFEALTTSYFIDSLNRRFDYTGSDKFLGYLAGTLDFRGPHVRAAEEISHRLARFYQPGFMATDRMDAGFTFAQQRAVVISSGSWDFQTLRQQAAQSGFEMGVFKLPLPGRDDPEFGRYSVFPEAAGASETKIRFGITRGSKHPEVAVKFLKFMTCRRINGEMNKIIGWVPCIRGAEVLPDMGPLLDTSEGYPTQWRCQFAALRDNGKTYINDQQAYWQYISGATTYDQYVDAVEKRFVADGMFDMYQELLYRRQQLPQRDQTRSYFLVKRAVASDTAGDRDRIRTLELLERSNADFRCDIADYACGLYTVSQLDNARTRALRPVPEYSLYLREMNFDVK